MLACLNFEEKVRFYSRELVHLYKHTLVPFPFMPNNSLALYKDNKRRVIYDSVLFRLLKIYEDKLIQLVLEGVQ